MTLFRRFLARQYARPHGWIGRAIIGPYLDRLSRGLNVAALAALEVRPDETVLELGFGGGALLADLLAADAQVAGVDASTAMVERARRRFRKAIAAGRLSVAEGSAESLPLPAASIDKACSVNSLYFWRDPAIVLAEFARVLRPDGRLVLAFQSAEQVRAWPGHRHGFAAHDEAEVATWLRDAGFVPGATHSGRDSRLGAYHCIAAWFDSARSLR